MKNKTAKEFWREKFDEYPQSDAEKLAIVMMQKYAVYLYLANKLPFLKWTKEKPKLTKECLLIAATLSGGKWGYELFRIQKTEFGGEWCWTLSKAKEDEWEDYEDLHSDLYCIIELLNN